MSNTDSLVPYGTALLRVTLGVAILAHGLLKVFVFGFAGSAGFFESLGLPAIFAYLTILGEVAGGVALILGIWTRLVSLLIVPIMLGALWVHSGNGWVFSNAGGGWEYPAMWTILYVVQAMLGDGAFALKTIPGLRREPLASAA